MHQIAGLLGMLQGTSYVLLAMLFVLIMGAGVFDAEIARIERQTQESGRN